MALGVAVLAVAAAVALRWTRRRGGAGDGAGACPALGQSVQAWVEGGGGPLRPPLAGWVAARSRVPRFGARWVAALPRARWCWSPASPAGRRAPRGPDAAGRLRAGRARAALAVAVHVVPPAYAGQPEVDAAPPRVEALKGSTVAVRIASAPGPVRVSEPGAADRTLQPGESMSLQLAEQPGPALRGWPPRPPVVLQLMARPDRPPEVVLESSRGRPHRHPGPGRIRGAGGGPGRRGGGGPGPPLDAGPGSRRGDAVPERDAARAPHGLAQRARPPPRCSTPGALGMRAGDSLVLWAEATDGNAVDGPGVGRSASRLLRWETPLPELAQGGKGPPLPAKGPLTERELLRRAEALVKSGLPRGRAPAAGAATGRGPAHAARVLRLLRPDRDRRGAAARRR